MDPRSSRETGRTVWISYLKISVEAKQSQESNTRAIMLKRIHDNKKQSGMMMTHSIESVKLQLLQALLKVECRQINHAAVKQARRTYRCWAARWWGLWFLLAGGGRRSPGVGGGPPRWAAPWPWWRQCWGWRQRLSLTVSVPACLEDSWGHPPIQSPGTSTSQQERFINGAQS